MMGSRRFSLCMYAVVWIGVALLLAAAGLYMDDYHYLHEFIGSHHYDVSFDFCEGAPITSVSQAVRSSWLHYFYWGNGRLGSAIMFFLNLLPRWLWPPLHATAFTCMLWLLIRLIAGESMRPLLWIGILASVWIVFPWHENMVASTYFINYVWTACLNLWLLYLLIPLSGRHIRRPVGALRATALMLLALCAATMHEGLSVVTDMYLFLLWLRLIRLWRRVSAFDRRTVRRNILLLSAVFLVYAVGSLAVIFAPSVIGRGSSLISLVRFTYLPGLIYFILVQNWLLTSVLLLLILIRFTAGRRALRRVLKRDGALILSAIAGILLMFYVDSGCLRSCWMAAAFLLISFWRILSRYSLPFSMRCKNTLAWSGLACYMLWMAAVDCMQYTYGRNMRAMERLVAESGSNLIYCDTYCYDSNPWWTLGVPRMPFQALWNMYMHLLPRHPDGSPLYCGTDKELIVLPASMRGVSFDSLPQVPGSAAVRGIFPNFIATDSVPQYLSFTFRGTVPRPWHTPGHILPQYNLGKNKSTVILRTRDVQVMTRRIPGYPGRPDTLDFFFPDYPPRSVYGLTLVSIDTIQAPKPAE
ncbi:MAG: hypothetical protein J6L73_07920 [Muribaculaceae bacterium]|nr:hypothetical protein [Muribaculaceae bacterium]